MKPVAMTDRMTFIPLTDHQRRMIYVALHALGTVQPQAYDRVECEELGRLVLGYLELSA
jgi:hypothetical protein